MTQQVFEEINITRKKQFKAQCSICGLGLITYMAIVYALQIVSTLALEVAAIYFDFSVILDDNTDIAVMVFSMLASFCITFLLIFRESFFASVTDMMTVNKNMTGAVALGVPVMFSAGISGVLIYLVAEQLAASFGITYDTAPLFENEYNIFGSIVEGVYVCLIAPVMEELIYRGFVLGSLRQYGTKTAIIASALVFSVMHANFRQIPLAFLSGLVLGMAAVYTESVLTSVCLHIIYNMIMNWVGMVPESYATVYALLVMALAIGGVVIFAVKRKSAKHIFDCEVPVG